MATLQTFTRYHKQQKSNYMKLWVCHVAAIEKAFVSVFDKDTWEETENVQDALGIKDTYKQIIVMREVLCKPLSARTQ